MNKSIHNSFYKNTLYVFFLVLFAVGFIACEKAVGPEEPFVSLDDKIGQMLMIGFRGMSIDETNRIAQDIQAGRIGGTILFDKDVALGFAPRNIESPAQVSLLTTQLQSFAPEQRKLFIAIDQEGGRVNRLKTIYGFPPSVTQQYLGGIDNLDTTAFYARRTAETLSSLGINLNFAPVVDLNINPENPVIGAIGRSFSAEPDVVVRNAAEMINVFHEYNIGATLKHFPGHGSSQSDSHLGFTDVTQTWQEIELEPYRRLIQQGLPDVIMTAHIFNSKWDPVFPATLSRSVITNMLRISLGWNGIVISDDMNMGAIRDHYGLKQAIEKSINAGVDILIFANNLVYDEDIAAKANAIIKELLSEGKISIVSIEMSYNRIMKLKQKLGLVRYLVAK